MQAAEWNSVWDASTTVRRLGAVAYVLALAVAALAIGALHTTVLSVVAAGLAVAATLVWFGAERVRTRTAANVVLAVGLGLIALTALQLVPLPIAWLARLSPVAADTWAHALDPIHQAGPRFAPLSLDPSATRVELLRGVAYVAAFMTALRIAHKREGTVGLELALVGIGLILALSAPAHVIFGATKVFGVYQPSDGVSPRHLAALLNPNHLAQYLNVAYCLILAHAVAARPPIPRVLAASIAIVLVATQVWVASRGGVLSMIVGTILVVGLTHLEATKASRFVSGALIAAGVAIMILAGTEGAWDELASADVSKLHLFRQASTTWRDFPVFGMGRGAFEAVFPAYEAFPGNTVFRSPDNVVVQWLCEWGIVPGVAALVGLVYALHPRSALARSRPAIGAWAAVATGGLQSLTECGAEVPAIVLAIATCAAIVVAGSAGVSWSRSSSWGARPTLIAVAIPVVVVAAIAGARLGEGELESDWARLFPASLAPDVGAAAFRAEITPALLRHPADPIVPFTGALAAVRNGEPILPWIERVLTRARIYGPAHLVLARAIAPLSPSQARLEYRLAVEQDERMALYVQREAVRLIHDDADAIDVAPRGVAGLPLLEALSTTLGARLPATRHRIDAEILRRDPRRTGPLLRAAHDASNDLSLGAAAPWCAADRQKCADQAIAAARHVEEVEPAECDAYAAEASIVGQTSDWNAALDLLDRALDHVNNRSACMRTSAGFAVQAGLDARAGDMLERISRASCVTDGECADNLAFVASMELRRGHPARALAYFKRAAERAADPEPYLAESAGIASGLGMHGDALSTYTDLAERHPENPKYKAAAERERAALAGLSDALH